MSSSLTAAVTTKRHQSCHEGRAHVTVTELLIDGISSQKNVLNVVLLILLKSTSRLSLNRRVTVCYEDSGRYMAKV